MNISTLGINKGKIRQFNSKGIYTLDDLVNYLPKEYKDFRNDTKVDNLQDGGFYSVIGKVRKIDTGAKYVRVTATDKFEKKFFITWFFQEYVLKELKVGEVFNFCGKVEINEMYGAKQILNPMFFSKDLEKYKKIIPVYPKINGMSSKYLLNSLNTAITLIDKEEFLDNKTLTKFNLINTEARIKYIHQPKSMEEVEKAKKRILFDDLYYFASVLAKKSEKSNTLLPIDMSKADTINDFINSLPFELTNDQLNITRDIFSKMRKGEKVNALVQGDVGSGKTIVAFLLMLIASENGYQSSLMTPTNVLASQHYQELKEIGSQMGYSVGFLSGNLKAKEKREVLEGVKTGKIDMVVGTHAIISEGVKFKNQGLFIIDEEHRFGVLQRDKDEDKVHKITMSATPIPRSLALTVYGEGTDVYNINQLPKGRKSIKTAIVKNKRASYTFMKKEIDKGRQCYIVCPLIDESSADVMKGVLSVSEVYEEAKDVYKGTDVKIEMINGKMKNKEVEEIIESFAKGNIDILISTTIIEVGVNVPNATVMTIQNAERFGLAQLHQLRGRVGRGSFQSYCMLLSDKEESERLKIMENTTNGFEIAKADLDLRGAGEFLGTRQSGENKYIMLMLANQKLFNSIREEIKKITEDEARLVNYENYLRKATNAS